jgi:hypothetical protein
VGLIPSSLIEIRRSFGGYASFFSIARPPETPVNFHQTTWHCFQEESIVQVISCLFIHALIDVAN